MMISDEYVFYHGKITTKNCIMQSFGQKSSSPPAIEVKKGSGCLVTIFRAVALKKGASKL
jgi:hypothetical protein